ncbi:MAG: glycosyltransferase [Candidatus Pacebacteria bacterium]|nr:glycosyltransferase [Candidatus Paceibacterota bacterium]
MKTISTITQSCVPGGVYRVALTETYLLNKINHYNANYYSIIYSKNHWDLFDELSIPVQFLGLQNEMLSRVFGDIFQSRKITKDLKNSELIIAHNNPSAKIALKFKKKYGIPFLFYLHDSLSYPILGSITHTSSLICPQILEKIEKKFIAEASAVVVNSKITFEKVIKTHNLNTQEANKIKIIYPTLNKPLTWKEMPENRKKYMLIVGRIDHEAFYYLHEIIKSIKIPLVIAGFGHPKNPGFHKIMKLYSPLIKKKMVKVILSPSDEKLTELYKNAFLFLYPGHENFNMSAMEAISTACPILIADTSGILEIFTEDLKRKCSLPKENTRLWVERIEKIIKNKELCRLGKECWEVSLKHSTDEHMKKLLEVIREIK